MPYDAHNETLCSIDAEQAVIGAVMFDTAVFWRISGTLKCEHFFDPVHRLIFGACARLIESGKSAAPTLLESSLSSSQGFADVGGRGYLERLARSVPSLASVGDYARLIADLAARRRLQDAARAITALAADRNGEAADAIREAERLIDGVSAEPTAVEPKTIRAAIAEWLEESDRRIREEAAPGVLCGLTTLDEKLSGFRPGKVYIVAGRPGMGKTTLLNKIALGISERGPVAISTLEMSAADLSIMAVTDRMRDYGVRMPYIQAENGIFADGDWEPFQRAVRAIEALPILIDDAPSATVSHVRRFARRAKAHFGSPLAALIVDYMGLIDSDRPEKLYERVTAISREVTRLAREMDIPVIVGCQINRAVEARDMKRPALADLRDSGAVEQDAFAVILLYRPAYYHAAAEPKKSDGKYADWEIEMQRLRVERPLEVIIAKNRRGPTGTIELWCEVETAAIRDKPFDPGATALW